MSTWRDGIVLVIGAALCAVCAGPLAQPVGRGPSAASFAGPLRRSATNPRYFTDGRGRAIYLTGLQEGWEMQDDAWSGYAAPGTRVRSDFLHYLDLVSRHQLNYLRLWNLENTAWDRGPREMIGGPLPYVRTGPGKAKDGGLKWNLDRFDIGNLAAPAIDSPHFFERLRARCLAARDRGIYLAVMLFEGFGSVHGVSPGNVNPGANPWFGHPFNVENNVNGVDADLDHDGWGLEFHSRASPEIEARQQAYVKQVVDTVGDLDNILYEIANESIPASKDWQFVMIEWLRAYEAKRPKQHPILMSISWGGPGQPNVVLYESGADAVAPAKTKQEDYESDPPPANGSKVVIADADHIDWKTHDPRFIWKNFLRGNNPIVFDGHLVAFDWETGRVVPDDGSWEAIRRAAGDTRRYAERMNLSAMQPAGELASTRYCLADPGGREYLVYQPEAGPFTANLAAGRYAYEWFDPTAGKVVAAGTVAVAAGQRPFTAALAGPAVLYLKAVVP